MSFSMGKLSASEKEKTKLRERTRRSITTKIFHGLRKYGGYNLAPRADINEVLRCLASEAGWIVEEDGTTYRSSSQVSSSARKMMISSSSAGGAAARLCFSSGGANLQENSNGNMNMNMVMKMMIQQQNQQPSACGVAAETGGGSHGAETGGGSLHPSMSNQHRHNPPAGLSDLQAQIDGAAAPSASATDNRNHPSAIAKKSFQAYDADEGDVGSALFNNNTAAHPHGGHAASLHLMEQVNQQHQQTSLQMQMQMQIQMMMMEEAACRGGDCSTTASPRHAPNRHSASVGGNYSNNNLSFGHGNAGGPAAASFFSPASYSSAGHTPTSSLSCLPSPSPFASPAASREVYTMSASRGHSSLHTSPAPSASAGCTALPTASGGANLAYNGSPPSQLVVTPSPISSANPRLIGGSIFCVPDSVDADAEGVHASTMGVKDELLTAVPLDGPAIDAKDELALHNRHFYGSSQNVCTDDQSLLLAAATMASARHSRYTDVDQTPDEFPRHGFMNFEEHMLQRKHQLLMLQQPKESSIFMANLNTHANNNVTPASNNNNNFSGTHTMYTPANSSANSYGHGASDCPSSALMMMQQQQMYSYNPQYSNQSQIYLQEARASNTNTPLGSPQRNDIQ